MTPETFLERNRERERDPRARKRVREWCARRGISTPEWAAKRPATRVRHAFDHGAAQYAAPAFSSVTLPETLRKWRAAGEGRIVRVFAGGVELHEHGAPVRRFGSVDEAVAAIGG